MSTRLSDAIFWIAVAACAIAQIFILRAVFRVTPAGVAAGSATASSPDGENVSVPTPHRLTEIVWVVLPVLLLALAFVGAWGVMHPLLPDFLPPGAEIIRR
jgi:heme/copper-type cytochrome/quinol oxidase subunit 2